MAERPVTEKTVLHLMTQDNQPYGSRRRCCEMCGVMIWFGSQPAWTDDRELYEMPSVRYVPCYKVKKS